MKFSKKDLKFSIITGLTTGVIAWRILAFLRPGLFDRSIFGVGFIIGVPILWIMGVNLGYFLGQWLSFFNQFGKFAAIGFTNAAVDFGILNLLIAWTGIASGGYYSVFKTISFIFSMLHSYFWNRTWAFEGSQVKEQGMEFAKFTLVTVLSALLNITLASLVVNFVHPVLGLSLKAWANVGAIIGSAIALGFSFVGFRLAVFKK